MTRNLGFRGWFYFRWVGEYPYGGGGINYPILRFANIYGFNQNFNQQGGAIMNFMNALTKKSKMSIFGSGKQKIDYIELADISDCIKIILNNSKLKNETFNVGSGKLTSIIDIAKMISNIGQKHFGYSTKITKIPAPDRKIWPDRLMSINKLKKTTGWKPKVSLKQGIEKLIENEVCKLRYLMQSHFFPKMTFH